MSLDGDILNYSCFQKCIFTAILFFEPSYPLLRIQECLWKANEDVSLKVRVWSGAYSEKDYTYVVQRGKVIWALKDVRVPLFPFHSLPVVSVATVVANFKRSETYCLLETFYLQLYLAVYSGGTQTHLVQYEKLEMQS